MDDCGSWKQMFKQFKFCLFYYVEEESREKRRASRSYWHFNNKLLQDIIFCESFRTFWSHWTSKKDYFFITAAMVGGP